MAARLQGLARARYRTRQFFLGLRSRLEPREIEVVRSLLNEHELRLFIAMEARDRRHSFNVLQRLDAPSQLEGEPSLPLRRAALLHDIGKGRLWVWERVAFVLLEAVSPVLVERLAKQHGHRWRRGLWRLRHHALLGAALLLDAGSDARTIELVTRHVDASAQGDLELARLVTADRAS